MASDQLGRCLFGIHLCLAVLSTALAAGCPAPRGVAKECGETCGEHGVLEANAYHCRCHPPRSSEPDDG